MGLWQMKPGNTKPVVPMLSLPWKDQPGCSITMVAVWLWLLLLAIMGSHAFVS